MSRDRDTRVAAEKQGKSEGEAHLSFPIFYRPSPDIVEVEITSRSKPWTASLVEGGGDTLIQSLATDLNICSLEALAIIDGVENSRRGPVKPVRASWHSPIRSQWIKKQTGSMG